MQRAFTLGRIPNGCDRAGLAHADAVGYATIDVVRSSAPLPRTFYDRYQAAATPHRDGRQPLPATFAARWIQGGPAQFQTSFKIWREGKSGVMSCTALTANTKLVFVESVAFDENENAVADVPTCRALCFDEPPSTAATGLRSIADTSTFPRLTNGAVAGWLYLNLDNDSRDPYASSSWVVTTMRAQGRFSADMVIGPADHHRWP